MTGVAVHPFLPGRDWMRTVASVAEATALADPAPLSVHPAANDTGPSSCFRERTCSGPLGIRRVLTKALFINGKILNRTFIQEAVIAKAFAVNLLFQLRVELCRNVVLPEASCQWSPSCSMQEVAVSVGQSTTFSVHTSALSMISRKRIELRTALSRQRPATSQPR